MKQSGPHREDCQPITY